MSIENIRLSAAPASWGVDNIENPYIPNWLTVLDESAEAGYRGLETGPYRYMPLDYALVSEELLKRELSIVAGTIFDDIASKENHGEIIRQTHEICAFLSKLLKTEKFPNQHFQAPYMTIMDWGHDERDFTAGHFDKAPRLVKDDWIAMINLLKEVGKISYEQYGIRSVMHPHAGGYIEFSDEIERLVNDVPYDYAGLCIDTGHTYYSGMDPVIILEKYKDVIDYVHFKDVMPKAYQSIMKKNIRFFDGVAEGTMGPIGRGALDYPAILNQLVSMNYEGPITLELERDPRNADSSLLDVKMSLDYLREIGF